MKEQLQRFAQKARDIRPSLLLQVAFWLAMNLAFWLLSREVVHGELSSEKKILSFDFAPSLFLFSILGLIATLVGLAIALRRVKSQNGAWLVMALPLIVVAAGGLLTSLNPSTLTVVDREYVPTPSSVSENKFVVPFFFSTGGNKMSNPDKKALSDLVKLFGMCTNHEVFVQGFASSTKYQPTKDCDSDCQNKNLAQRRAIEVSKYINDTGKGRYNATYQEWDNYSHMRRFRRLVDESSPGRIIPDLEKLNRRAELTWTQGTCKLAERASSATASASSAPDPTLADIAGGSTQAK